MKLSIDPDIAAVVVHDPDGTPIELVWSAF